MSNPLHWSTSCLDWERRIVAGESLVPCAPLFPKQAEFALRIFRELILVDVAGQPRMAEACEQWFNDFVAAIFGAYDEDTGKRLILEFFLLISKKNMKSTGAAGIMLTALVWNWRASAEFIIIAPTKEIADNSFYPARDMVRADDELNDLFKVQDHLRTITHQGNKAFLKIVAADSQTVSGKKATGILIDELWLFGKMANAENMLREATGGLLSRPEGFIIYLTTQSDDPPSGIFKKKLKYARGVRDGRINDPRFLPVLYEFPQKMLDGKEYLDTKNFYITNPNLGVSVDEEYLNREFAKAQEDGEDSLCGFMAKHLNIEIGLALRSENWNGAEFWQAASGDVTLELILARCEVVVAGVDGGGLDDLLGLCILGREVDSGLWLAWTRAWCHRIALSRRKSEASRYLDFEADGDLVIVDDPGQDVAQVAEILKQCDESGLLYKIGVDPAGIGDVVDSIIGLEIDAERIVGISQGWRLNGAIKTAERKLPGRRMIHAGQRLMAWCVGNAKVEPKGNAIMITKQASGTGKIDPLMALFNAVAIMALNPQPQGGPSVYEKRGVLTF